MAWVAFIGLLVLVAAGLAVQRQRKAHRRVSNRNERRRQLSVYTRAWNAMVAHGERRRQRRLPDYSSVQDDRAAR